MFGDILGTVKSVGDNITEVMTTNPGDKLKERLAEIRVDAIAIQADVAKASINKVLETQKMTAEFMDKELLQQKLWLEAGKGYLIPIQSFSRYLLGYSLISLNLYLWFFTTMEHFDDVKQFTMIVLVFAGLIILSPRLSGFLINVVEMIGSKLLGSALSTTLSRK